ncbi:MAG TPA: hypothetical protein VHD38_02085 [Candidatus Paceibacterota bacterium]|nr:hypothetical protein [Candidatus Paceibacterota bacterium]
MGVLQQLLRTPLGTTATVSVVALCLVALWRGHAVMQTNAQALSFSAAPGSIESPVTGDQVQEALLLGSADASATSSSGDPIAMIGPVVVAQLAGSYAGLQDQGTVSQQTIQASADAVAQNMKAAISYKIYAVSDIKTSDDTSYKAMLAYRDAMRTALAPLLQNSQNELDLYAKYFETSDPSYLAALFAQAQNYRAALAAAAAVTVPRDAVNYHRDILNALSKFLSTIEQMAAHQGDALAEASLLRNYNDAEQGMYDAFNALSRYYSQKTP